MDLKKCDGIEDGCLNNCKNSMIEVNRKVDHSTKESDITYADGCVWNLVTPTTREYYRMYRLYQEGFLLEPGAVNDQPIWYINIMLYIANEYSNCKSDAEKRALGK